MQKRKVKLIPYCDEFCFIEQNNNKIDWRGEVLPNKCEEYKIATFKDHSSAHSFATYYNFEIVKTFLSQSDFLHWRQPTPKMQINALITAIKNCDSSSANYITQINKYFEKIKELSQKYMADKW